VTHSSLTPPVTDYSSVCAVCVDLPWARAYDCASEGEGNELFPQWRRTRWARIRLLGKLWVIIASPKRSVPAGWVMFIVPKR
jgi:hypothetical protein